jgi:hypothetical protein
VKQRRPAPHGGMVNGLHENTVTVRAVIEL